MPLCPVCDHPLEGEAACPVCGRASGIRSADGASVAPLEGLEETRLPPAPDTGERLPGLEPSGAAPEGEVPLEPLAAQRPEWLEESPATLARAPGGASTFVPSACRYCRAPVVPGEAFCGGCGLRVAPLPAPAFEERAAGCCRFCGAPVTAGRCAACGARLPEAAA